MPSVHINPPAGFKPAGFGPVSITGEKAEPPLGRLR
jgi:hypothetical protein